MKNLVIEGKTYNPCYKQKKKQKKNDGDWIMNTWWHHEQMQHKLNIITKYPYKINCIKRVNRYLVESQDIPLILSHT
jgi:hypothetical protein